MDVQSEIQVEAMLSDLVMGLTMDRNHRRCQSIECFLNWPARLTVAKLDQKRRHGRCDVHDSIVKSVTDAGCDRKIISLRSWLDFEPEVATDSLCNDIRHRRQDHPRFLLTLLDQGVRRAAFLVF